MTIIRAEDRAAWQALADKLAAQFPSVGKRVRVVAGRKHLGVDGIVTWHGRDRYADTRHLSDAQLHLRDMEGRRGFRIGIRPLNGGPVFFISADSVEVISTSPLTPDEEQALAEAKGVHVEGWGRVL